MNKNEEAKPKRKLILEAIQDLSDEEILNNVNFTFWGDQEVITSNHSHGNGNPPTPPPPPPPPPEE